MAKNGRPSSSNPASWTWAIPDVLEPAQDLSFMVKPLDELRCDHPGPDHLERDGAARVILFGLVDRAHAPFPVTAEDAIAADLNGQPRLSPSAAESMIPQVLAPGRRIHRAFQEAVVVRIGTQGGGISQ